MAIRQLIQNGMASPGTGVNHGSYSLASSGTCLETKTTTWSVFIQNVQMMYTRKTQYSPTNGAAEFNYLDVNFQIQTELEQFYGNSSACDAVQGHNLTLDSSDSVNGGLGQAGLINTSTVGMIRREARTGDTVHRTNGSGNLIACKQPGLYASSMDSSSTANAEVFDMLVQAENQAPEFKLWLVNI